MSGAESAAGTPARIESTRSLIAVNAITILLALIFQWPLMTLLLPYWIQSVVIGYYSRRRILALERFSVQGFKINGRIPDESEATKRSTANFFALHYGFFHAGYLVFLSPGFSKVPPLEWIGVAAAAGSFVWNHRQSFLGNAQADRRGKPNLGSLMFLPYLRVVPMHLTILAGGAIQAQGALPLLIFGALKTTADVLMHIAEHRILQKNAGQPATAAGAD